MASKPRLLCTALGRLMRDTGYRGGVSWEDGTPMLTLVWGTEWWDDRLHARGSSKTWDSLPPNKRKKAPLVSGILPHTVA